MCGGGEGGGGLSSAAGCRHILGQRYFSVLQVVIQQCDHSKNKILILSWAYLLCVGFTKLHHCSHCGGSSFLHSMLMAAVITSIYKSSTCAFVFSSILFIALFWLF